MTATTIHHPRSAAPATRRGARSAVDDTVYRRRRLLVSLLFASVLSAAGLGAQAGLTGPGDVPASAAGAGRVPVLRQVRAEPGDSLWSLATEHRGSTSMRQYVDALVELNGDTTAIQAGELVTLP